MGLFGRKNRNLQPWCDYFEMLREYEDKGFLEVLSEKGEAYVTRPALHAMSEGSDPTTQAEAVLDTARRIQVYAVWKSRSGTACYDRPFALHVVADVEPHDLLYTILITWHRVWWKLWRRDAHFEVIDYIDENKKR